MRRTARNAIDESGLRGEDLRIIAQKPHIMWVFYHGKLSNGEIAVGYNPVSHESWCIPLSIWRSRDSMRPDLWEAECKNSARKLRIIDNGVVKINYSDPENNKWWVLAPTPESKPVYGMVVRAQPPDRAILEVVPEGGQGSGGDIQTRIQNLKAEFGNGLSSNDKEYPGIDEVWVATMRVEPDGHVKVYPDGQPIPLLTLYRDLAEIKTKGTRFDHMPDQLQFSEYAVHPASKEVPSTNTLNVQTFFPTTSEFLMVTAIALSIAQFINKQQSKRSESTSREEVEIVPTEFIDYEDLKRVNG